MSPNSASWAMEGSSSTRILVESLSLWRAQSVTGLLNNLSHYKLFSHAELKLTSQNLRPNLISVPEDKKSCQSPLLYEDSSLFTSFKTALTSPLSFLISSSSSHFHPLFSSIITNRTMGILIPGRKVLVFACSVSICFCFYLQEYFFIWEPTSCGLGSNNSISF